MSLVISWNIDCNCTDRQPSNEFPNDPTKDLIYKNVVSEDWNRYIPLTLNGDFVKDANGEYIYVLEH